MNMLNLYRYPYSFGKNIIKNGMGIGNQAKTVSQIAYSINQINQYLTDDLTTKAIFSLNINPRNLYFPFKGDSVN
jgi:hypothetical protein